MSPFSSPVALFQVLEGCYKVSPQPSLLQAEQPQIPQPFLIAEVLQPSDHFCGPPLDLFQHPCLSCARGSRAGCRTSGGVSPEQSRGAESPPSPCWPRCFWCSQGYGWPSFWVELLVNQHHKVFPLRAALNPFSTQPVYVLGIAPTHVQDLALEPGSFHMEMAMLLKDFLSWHCLGNNIYLMKRHFIFLPKLVFFWNKV